jgi:ribonuclease HII
MSSKYKIGIDEVGRGPVAGPIVGAAVFSMGSAEQRNVLKQVRDSKLLSQKKRELLSELIVENFLFSIKIIDNQIIDQRGIQMANILVMQEALNDLLKKIININHGEINIVADYVGAAKKYWPDTKLEFFQHGESVHEEIAAASIIAKVYRDQLMTDWHKEFPLYNFDQHKGYGTKEHLRLIKEHGLCPLHRRSFLEKYLD